MVYALPGHTVGQRNRTLRREVPGESDLIVYVRHGVVN